MDKDEFVKTIKDIRTFLASEEDVKCTCLKIKCEFHGNCYKCVRIHRHFGDHVPDCLQFILKDKVKGIAQAAEMTADSKSKTSDEFWDYLNKVAPLENK